MSMWMTLGAVIAVRILIRAAKYWWQSSKPKGPPPKALLDAAKIAELKNRWDDSVAGLGATGKQYLVIGTGFLGLRLVRALITRGETRVRAFDVALPSDVIPGVEWIQGNVNDIPALRKALKGVDVVYSTFALIRYWETLAYQLKTSAGVNIEGTASVLEACIQENVPVLISTSTSNVCIRNTKDVQIFNETTPYISAADSPNHYAYTKAVAEQLVLEANGKTSVNGRTFTTACIRPCSGIFGARDRFCIQRLLRLRCYDIVVTANIDWVYVDNIVWSHLLLEKALASKPEQVAGKAFCINNDCAPMTIVDLFNKAVDHCPDLVLQYRPAWLLLGLADFLDRLRSIFGERFPKLGELELLSRGSFIASGLKYVLQSTRAHSVLGYKPVFTVDEAVMLSVAEWEEENYKSS